MKRLKIKDVKCVFKECIKKRLFIYNEMNNGLFYCLFNHCNEAYLMDHFSILTLNKNFWCGKVVPDFCLSVTVCK